MKKIILIILILLTPLFSIAQETSLEIENENNNTKAAEEIEEYTEEIDEENDIYDNPDAVLLDFKNTNSNKLNIKNQQKGIKNKTLKINRDKDISLPRQNIYHYQNNDIYSKKTTSYGKEKNFKNMTFGAKYDNSFTPDTFDQSRTLFSKYKINRLTLNTSYKNSELTSFGQQFKGIFSFSPEYKINDKMSFQSVYSRNISDRSNKNEVIFTLKPFKDDRMDFNLGAGQIYYEDATPTRSQFNFSTKFKF